MADEVRIRQLRPGEVPAATEEFAGRVSDGDRGEAERQFEWAVKDE